jgi:hypothetical protein
MAIDVNAMVDAMVDALQTAGKLEGMEPADIAKLKADMVVTENARWQYMKANMGIKGVKVDATGVISAPTTPVPVPNDGGAAILATMTANSAKDLNQSNDGTGLIE